MGCIDATSLAYQRSVLATNPAAARGRFSIRHSVRDRSFTLVRGPDSRGLPPSSEALAGAGRARRGLGGNYSKADLNYRGRTRFHAVTTSVSQYTFSHRDRDD